MSEWSEYPGANASAEEIMQLADEYCRAAETLLEGGRKGRPLSRAPSRLCAIHAIELYLNALLLHLGNNPKQVRSRKHDLAERASLAVENGLKLRKRTAEHLIAMTQRREYLVLRYSPEMPSTLSQVNRLMATLSEVGKKVREFVRSGRSYATSGEAVTCFDVMASSDSSSEIGA
jgi:hypothetical protein